MKHSTAKTTALDYAKKHLPKAEKANDPLYRREHIKEHYPEHYEFVMDIVAAFPEARMVAFYSPTLKWEKEGIIKGEGVPASLDHRKSNARNSKFKER